MVEGFEIRKDDRAVCDIVVEAAVLLDMLATSTALANHLDQGQQIVQGGARGKRGGAKEQTEEHQFGLARVVLDPLWQRHIVIVGLGVGTEKIDMGGCCRCRCLYLLSLSSWFSTTVVDCVVLDQR